MLDYNIVRDLLVVFAQSRHNSPEHVMNYAPAEQFSGKKKMKIFGYNKCNYSIRNTSNQETITFAKLYHS
jgi:hypothetical protein